MESLSLATPLLGLIALVWAYYTAWRMRNHTKSKKFKEVPQPGGAWPVIGHLHLVTHGDLPHITLAAMADKCGPIFMIRLGVNRAVVVSDWKIAKECFTTNDKALANRPIGVAIKLMGFNNAMFGFTQYGSYWREVRKIVIREILSSHRLESLKNVWDSEISTSIKELYQIWANENIARGGPVLVEMRQWFADLTLNVAVRMVAGKRYFGAISAACDKDESRRCQNATRDFFRLVGLFVVSDALPFLGWLDLGGYEMEMKRTGKEIDSILQGWLDEHKRNKVSGAAKGHEDFMDVLMSILEEAKIPDFDADTITKATCFTLILGGSDTIMVTLTWALSLLLNNPLVLKKAQDELDIHVGKYRQVDQSDIKNLRYLEAIIKETMRLYPAGPLLGPREAIEDCIIAGYQVPAGTRVIVNAWKMHRDPLMWSDPCEFQPERFLMNRDLDVKGQHFELIPFGSGRRACPAISFALEVVPLALARLLHWFELKIPLDCHVDMMGSAGLVNAKATPLDVLVTPRLSPELYA